MPNSRSRVLLVAMLLLGCLSAVSLEASGPLNKRLLRRNHYGRKAGEAAADGQYSVAIKYYGKLLAIEPEDRLGRYNLACVLSRDGQTDAALDALAQSIAMGYDDPGHLAEDSDLDPLRGTARFAALVAAAEACRVEQIAGADSGVAGDEVVVLALHRYGGHSRACRAIWEGAAAQAGAAVWAPRGPVALSRTGTVFYGWSTRRAPMDADLAVAGERVASALRAVAVPRERLVLTGRDQGALVALELMRRGAVNVGRVVLVAPPSLPAGDWADWSGGGAVRVAIVVGSQDPKGTKEFAAVLRYAGCSVEIIERPGSLEVLPADASELLAEALAFVLGD